MWSGPLWSPGFPQLLTRITQREPVQPRLVQCRGETPSQKCCSTFGEVWPEFFFHDEIARTYAHPTYTTFVHLNLYPCDEQDEMETQRKYDIVLQTQIDDSILERMRPTAGWRPGVLCLN